jgi:lambda family phage portal protein
MRNLFDSIVSAFNPAAGLKREMARNALKKMRGFEAASRGRRTDGWRTTGSDANTVIGQGQGLLRDRARAMRRDNPYAEKGISAIASNTVGYGIVPDPRGRARQKKRALEMWARWAETTACDFEGISDFYGMQNLAIQSIAESGEVLLRRVWARGENALNFKLQILEADHLDEDKTTTLAEGGYIEQGIQYDQTGKRTHYWLFPNHPGGNIRNLRASSVSEPVPAEDIAHIFLRKRPGQTRGYSWMAPVILRMRNFDEMEDAVIEQAKVAACFAAIITTEPEMTAAATGRSNYMLPEAIEPGMLERLNVGESVTFGTPPTFSGYESYSKQSLRATAVGLGLPYEVLTGDLNGVSFTSGRMGWLEFGRNIDVWRWHMIVPQMCARVWDWFNEAAALSENGWSEPIPAGWVAPRRDLIDPVQELNAIEKELRIGGLSFSGMLKERGINDTEAHIRQIQEDNAALDAAGLLFDGDPRNVAKAGAGIAPAAAAGTLAETEEAT